MSKECFICGLKGGSPKQTDLVQIDGNRYIQKKLLRKTEHKFCKPIIAYWCKHCEMTFINRPKINLTREYHVPQEKSKWKRKLLRAS